MEKNIECKKCYYECKRCFYKCNQLNDMKKHLNKKNKCERKLESFKYKEEELYELSLTKNTITEIIKKVEEEATRPQCDRCNSFFSTRYSLKRHQEHTCKFYNKNAPTNTTYITNNNNFNNINNNINNINIQIVNSFEKNWSTDHLKTIDKYNILENEYKYTNALEKILENDVNLNVLIDGKDNSIVLKNNELIKMNIKDLVRKVMEKIYYTLFEFGEEVKNGDIEMALGMVMGAQLTIDHAQLHDASLVERFFEIKQLPWQAMEAANDRQFNGVTK